MNRQMLFLSIIILYLFTNVPVLFSTELEIQPLNENMQPIETEIDDGFQYDISDFRLEDALKIAIKNNRTIKTSEQNIEKAEGRVKQARATRGAKVSFNMGQTWLDNGYPSDSSQKTYIELSQPLYLGKKDKAVIASARFGRDVAKSSHTLTKQSIVMHVSNTYYSWLNAREIEEVGKMDIDLAQAHYDLVKKRYQAQQASKYELLRADVRLVQIKSNYIKEQNDTQMIRLSLLNILSLPVDTAIDTSSKLEMEDISPDVKNDIKKAIHSREDLKIKRSQKEIAKQSLVSASSEKEATLSLWGQAGIEDPKSITRKKDDYWQAGLVFNLPLLDGGLASGKIKEAKANVTQADNDYDDVLELAQLEIFQAAITLNNSKQVIISQKENLKQAEETLRLAKVRYENGLFTQVDLFDAELAWSNARLSHISAIFSHHRSRLAYLLAIGHLGRDIKGF